MEKETFIEYLNRKITHTKADSRKMLFSKQVKNHLLFRLSIAPYKAFVGLKNLLFSAYNQNHSKGLALIQNAIADPKGLGGLELKLHNAHIPKQYYYLFYKMPYIVNQICNKSKLSNDIDSSANDIDSRDATSLIGGGGESLTGFSLH